MVEWQPVSAARVDGTLCALRLRDRFSHYEVNGPYFFHEDGHWYSVEPPQRVVAKVTHFKPIMGTESGRHSVSIKAADAQRPPPKHKPLVPVDA